MNRQIAKTIIQTKIRELENFCRQNGFDVQTMFGFGRSWSSSIKMNENGEMEFSNDDDESRSYSTLEIRITMEDSKWGDNPKMIKMLEGMINFFKDSMKELPNSDTNDEVSDTTQDKLENKS